MPSDELELLLGQYQQAAEQIRHQDVLAWQTFFIILGVNGVVVSVLGNIASDFFSHAVSIPVSLIGFISSLFGALHVFRAIRYQEHAYGVAKESSRS